MSSWLDGKEFSQEEFDVMIEKKTIEQNTTLVSAVKAKLKNELTLFLHFVFIII
jgi:hypothetical protein